MTTKLSGPMLPPKSGGAPKQLMVLLHGYGANGQDLIGLGAQWRDTFPDMLFVAPDAPSICAQNPGGFEWFPLSIDRTAGRIEGLRAVRPVVVNFLIDLWAQTGLTARDTVLCGFSQGTMVALNAGLSLDQQLAGIIGFSGAFLPPDGFGPDQSVRPPVALIHGDRDQVLEVELSRQAARDLMGAGFDVSLHISKNAGHGIAPDGLDFATSFLAAVVGVKA